MDLAREAQLLAIIADLAATINRLTTPTQGHTGGWSGGTGGHRPDIGGGSAGGGVREPRIGGPGAGSGGMHAVTGIGGAGSAAA